MGTPIINGRTVESRSLGPLRSARKSEDLRALLTDHGYVFLRRAIPRYLVDAARNHVLNVLGALGEVAEPYTLGIASGSSRRHFVPDLAKFWQRVTESTSIRAVSHGWHSRRFVDAIFRRPTIAHDYVYLRAYAEGIGTRLHCDAPYFGIPGSEVLTSWIALSEIGPQDGALYLAEPSTRLAEMNATGDPNRGGEIASDPAGFVSLRGGRLLTHLFRPGDLVIFDMNKIHGSFDNQCCVGRIRLSLDVRHQLRIARRDRRFFGNNPLGIGGAGYGEMRAILPMKHTSPDQLRETAEKA